MIAIVTFLTCVIYQRNAANNRPPCYGGWIPWLGCAIEFGKCPLHFIEKCRKKLGPIFTLKVAGMRMTFLTDPDDYKHFFASGNVDFQQAVKGTVEKTASIPGEAFLKNHTRMHDTIKWTLTQGNLEPFCQRLQAKFNKELLQWGKTGEADLYDLIRGTMYKAILDNLFGDLVLPTSPEHAFRVLEKHFVKFDEDFEYASRLPSVLLRDWNTSKWWLLNLFRNTISKEWKNDTKQNETLFRKLVQNVEGPYAANFAMLMMWASLANAIPITFWTIAFILCNPEIHARVRQEINEVYGNGNGMSTDFQVTLNDLAKLPYLRNCIMEAIRLRSPGVIVRGVKKPIHVKGYVIPAGDMLMLSPYWTHQNPKYFPDPECFNPDRWLSFDMEKSTYLDGFVAFGAGRYQCPGRWFALMEMQLFMTCLFYKFGITSLDPLPKHSPLHVVGSQHPETPMRVRYTRIN